MRQWMMVLALGAACCHAETVGFRGDGSGRFEDASVVTSWQQGAGTNILWQTKLPDWGNASPVPVQDVVFVCAEPFRLLCLDAGDGHIRWAATNDYAQLLSPSQRDTLKREHAISGKLNKLAGKAHGITDKLRKQIGNISDREKLTTRVTEAIDALTALTDAWAPTPLASKYTNPRKHGGTGYSSPTPVSDGKHVWAVFGNGVTACYTLEGKRVWIRLIERPSKNYGHSASPRLADGLLIVPINAVHALDPQTGEEQWATKSKPRFGTPVVTRIANTTVLVTPNGEILRVSDGENLAGGMKALSYNAPVVANGIAVFFNERQAAAYRLPQTLEGDVKPEELWKASVPRERMYASPVVHDGVVYCVGQKGTLVALDLESGDELFKGGVGVKGTCYASLTGAGNLLVLASEKGDVAFVRPGKKLDVTATCELGKLRASLIPDGKRLYARTMDHLFCLGPTD